MMEFFICCVAILIFIFALTLYFSSRWLKPITAITEAAKKIAAGDLSARISSLPSSHLGELSSAINHMVEQSNIRAEEAALGKSRLEAVFLSMFEGVLVVDRQGHILLMNQPLKDLLLIKEDPAGQKSFAVIRNIHIQDILQQALVLEKGVFSSEISLLFPEERFLLINAVPVLRLGKPEGAVLVFHDITKLRRLERVRQEFVANVSHELRTPVTSIKGYAETLLDGALYDKENAIDFLRIIHLDADRLARLIDDILSLSKMESASIQLQRTSCSVYPIVQGVIDGLNKKILEKNLVVKNEISKSVAHVFVDPDRMAQVVLNLIDNAVKYTPEGGQITISCEDKRSLLQVNVADSGVGIPLEDIPRVFERFYRVEKARSRDSGGTGLGLSIVKHLVQAHQGDVFVSSQVGQGSTFSFTIPKV